MTTKHSPLIRLHAARAAYNAAMSACPHWDMESDSDACHGCCDDLYTAQRELMAARKAAKAAEMAS